MHNFFILTLVIALLSCSARKITTEVSDSWKTSSDSCNVADSSDWQSVAVFPMVKKEHPKWLVLQGEDIFSLNDSISRLKDIPEDKIKDIQVRVASAGGCVVFVDLSDFYGSEMFPMRKDDKVYFYWGVPK